MAEVLENIYAQAMYELCEEQDCCAGAFEELTALEKVFDDNEDLVRTLRSPLIAFEDKQNILINIFSGRVSDTVLDFLCLVTQKGRAGCIGAICREFKKIYYAKNNILEVKVTTSQPLSERLEEKLVAKLENILGKKIELKKEVDPSIIGGIIVKYDNTELDSSVRGRLDRLRGQIDSVIA